MYYYLTICLVVSCNLLFGQLGMYKGVDAFKDGDYRGMLKVFSGMPKDDLRAKLWKARAYIMLEDYASADTLLQTLDQNQPAVQYAWARFYSLQYNQQKSLEYLGRYLKQSQRNFAEEVRIDESFNPIRVTKEWKIFWQEHNIVKSERLYASLSNLYGDGKYLDMLDNIEQLDKKYKKRKQILKYSALAYYGLASYKVAEKLFAKLSTQYRSDDLMYAAGKNAFKLEDYSKSIEYFDKVRVLDTFNYDLILYRALASFALGDQNNDGQLNSLIQVNNLEDSYRFVIEQYMAKKNYIKAIQRIDQFLKLSDIENGWFYLQRAICYKAMTKYNLAMKDLNHSLDLIQQKAEIYYLRGWVFLRQGNYSMACNDWERSLRQGHLKARKPINEFCK